MTNRTEPQRRLIDINRFPGNIYQKEDLKLIRESFRRSDITAIVGMICNDGLVVAADSQVTAGYLKTTTLKLHKIALGPIGTTVVAGAGFNDLIDDTLDAIRAYARKTPIHSRQELVPCLKSVMRSVKAADEQRDNSELDQTILLIAVLRSGSLRPVIYELCLGGYVARHRTFFATGTGHLVADDLLRLLWPRRCGTQQAMRIALYVIDAARRSVTGCGNTARVWRITSRGIRRMTQERRKRLRDYFKCVTTDWRAAIQHPRIAPAKDEP